MLRILLRILIARKNTLGWHYVGKLRFAPLAQLAEQLTLNHISYEAYWAALHNRLQFSNFPNIGRRMSIASARKAARLVQDVYQTP
jgi:hypothetical protein